MNCFLMYSDKEWINPPKYYDFKSIVQDLSLNVLARISGQEVCWDTKGVKRLEDSDDFIERMMAQALVVPCTTPDEIKYRQAILRDCLEKEDFIIEMYSLATNMLNEWVHLGKQSKQKASSQNNVSELVLKIHVLHLFLDTIHSLRELLQVNLPDFKSEGLINFAKRLEAEFPKETEMAYNDILNSISFFVTEENPEDEGMRRKPNIVLSCNLGNGLKIINPKLSTVGTKVIKFRPSNSPIVKVQKFFASKTPNSVSMVKSNPVAEQKADMEYKIVDYIVSCFTPFMNSFRAFFEQLQYQAAFYRGAITIKHHMDRYNLEYCFPTICEKNELSFDELKEFIMCIQQHIGAIGNTCSIKDKMLLIVTGANQGGKSTFLRSIGIAQIMMQCGLMVPAKSYKSAIFPSFFTHFTRREDSAMNSGRLDEELGRMSQIIDHLGPDSLILLNESFATTTEKEGSKIAYDIIKALNEHGVKILTVTHLLSFAQRVYDEMETDVKNGKHSDVEFFSAERKEDGTRTFKMIQHAPELTSFGLDLYKYIVGDKK